MLPSSDNEFLADYLRSLAKRRKPISRKVAALSCERVIEKDGDARRELVETVLRMAKGGEKITVRMKVWEDRWVWVDLRSLSNKTWIWAWTYEGRLLGPYDGRWLVEQLESMASTVFGLGKDGVAIAAKLWEPALAQGPKRLND